jgi:type I restriction enzyme S subunit
MIGQGRTRGQAALLELPAATNQNSAALIPSAKIESEFLHQYLTFRYATVRALSNSSGQGNLNAALIGGFHVPLPTLPEQRKIAEILRTWDDAIELTEAHVSRLQTRRAWLRMEVLTGRVRMGDHAEPWFRTPLRGVLREHKKRSSGSEEVFSVSVHKGLVNQKEHLGRSFAAANTDHYNLVNTGDIVYTKSPTGDFPLGIIKRSSVPGAVIVSPLYGVFTPQNPDLGVILDAYFESPKAVRNYLSPLVQKGAKNTISITNQGFLSGHLNLPGDPAEQSDLATLLTASRDEIAATQRQAELLRTQKRGLMQKLLTGQIRAHVAAETVPGGQDDD